MTHVSFKLATPLNSKNIQTGSRVAFETVHDAIVKTPQGDTVVPQGTVTNGIVTSSKKASRFFGRQGYLQVAMPTQIKDIKGNQFSLAPGRNYMSSEGGGARRYVSPLLSLFAFPLPFWIWRGKNAKLFEGFQAEIHAPSQFAPQKTIVSQPPYKGAPGAPVNQTQTVQAQTMPPSPVYKA